MSGARCGRDVCIRDPSPGRARETFAKARSCVVPRWNPGHFRARRVIELGPPDGWRPAVPPRQHCARARSVRGRAGGSREWFGREMMWTASGCGGARRGASRTQGGAFEAAPAGSDLRLDAEGSTRTWTRRVAAAASARDVARASTSADASTSANARASVPPRASRVAAHSPGADAAWRRPGWTRDVLYALTDPQVSNALAGAGAGAIAATIVCPLDVLKTRLQVSPLRCSGGDAYVSTYQSLAHIAKTEGVPDCTEVSPRPSSPSYPTGRCISPCTRASSR